MPQQLITGTDCCPCSCPDTVTVQEGSITRQIWPTVGKPIAAPDDPTIENFAVDHTNNGYTYIWNPTLAVWSD